MEYVIMTTTWTCPDGHVESMSEDLGDPADREQVMRVEDEIRCGGCRHKIDGKTCDKRVKRSRSESIRYV